MRCFEDTQSFVADKIVFVASIGMISMGACFCSVTG